MDQISQKTAELLFEIKAIDIKPKKPFEYTSGMISPIYIDNRLVMSYPKIRKQIIGYYVKRLEDANLLDKFALISGTATAAIPHAAFLSDRLDRPMIYVRDSRKGHGKENQIEGVVKKGEKTLIVEDHISTGGSTAGNARAVRDAGGIVKHAIATTTYEFEKASRLFEKLDIELLTLTTFTDIVEVAVSQGNIDKEHKELVLSWSKDPDGWADKMDIKTKK